MVLTPAAEIPLVGAGREPVDFARTIVSHGVAELPPNRVDLAARTLETTLPVPGGARTVRLTHAGGKLRRIQPEISNGFQNSDPLRIRAAQCLGIEAAEHGRLEFG